MTAPPAAPPPAAPPPAAPPADPGTEPRTLAELDDKIEALRQTLEAFIGQGHGQAAEHTASRLDRPSQVQEQIRAELGRLEAERDRKAAEAGRDSTIKSQGEQLEALRKQLAETPPVEPVRRLTRWIWGQPAKPPARKSGTP